MVGGGATYNTHHCCLNTLLPSALFPSALPSTPCCPLTTLLPSSLPSPPCCPLPCPHHPAAAAAAAAESVTEMFIRFGRVKLVRICSKESKGKLPCWLTVSDGGGAEWLPCWLTVG